MTFRIVVWHSGGYYIRLMTLASTLHHKRKFRAASWL